MFLTQIDEVLKTRSALTWIVTQEQHRIINYIARNVKQAVYTPSATTGLNLWNGEKWVLVLEEETGPVDDGSHPAIPTVIKDFTDSLDYVLEHGGIFIMPQAHLYTEKMIQYLASTYDDWLTAFYADDIEDMVISIVMLSHKDEVPPEITSVVNKINSELPDVETLGTIVDQTLLRMNEKTVSPAVRQRLVRAGQGLSEPGFVNVLTRSLAHNRTLDPKYINSLKVKAIGGAGILKIRTPLVTMNEVGGMGHAKEILKMTSNMWGNPQYTKAMGVKPLSKIVLLGVSGGGKSRLCEAAASALNLDLAEFSVSQAMSKFVGESEQNMRQVFEQIKALRPITLWTDELGRDLSGSGSSNLVDSGTTSRVHGAFLQGMQELPDDVFWVAAANDLSDLPPEMLRSGRIDQLLFVGFPTAEERQQIFKIHLGEEFVNYDLELLATRTPLFTGAEIESLIKHARFYSVGKLKRKPTTADIVEYAPKLKNRQWRLHKGLIVAMYEKAVKEWDWASLEQYNEAHLVIDAAKSQPKTKTIIPGAATVGV